MQHILVAQKYEAEDILKLLSGGKEFSELARRYSTCPSAAHGGDLGKIKWGKADPDFEEAVSILKPGQTTTVAIRTKFGYHIIKRIS